MQVDTGSILVGELGSHMPSGNQVCMLQWKILHDAMKIPHAATKTQHSQINIQMF